MFLTIRRINHGHNHHRYHRGVRHVERVLGVASEDLERLSGAERVLRGYVSTSAAEWAARRFSLGLEGAVFRVAVPPGASAAWMPLVGVEEYRDQAELLSRT